MAQLAPSTAEVLEFRCQFTYNVTQKSKKWNDGSLKYHTFNNLIRILDDSSNNIGRKHWQGDALQDGDEFLLDNVLVAVQDQLRSTQTDLAPLFDRQKKQFANNHRETPNSPIVPLAGRTNTQAQIPTVANAQNGPRLSHSSACPRPKHKSLSSLLGTSKGRVGKAIAPKSPYEVRTNVAPEYHEDEPAIKRCKHDASRRETWTVTTTTKPARAQSHKAQNRPSSTVQNRTKKTESGSASNAGQKTFSIKSVIDLTSDTVSEQEEEDRESARDGPGMRPARVPMITSLTLPKAQRRRSTSANADVNVEAEAREQHVRKKSDVGLIGPPESRPVRPIPRPEAGQARIPPSLVARRGLDESATHAEPSRSAARLLRHQESGRTKSLAVLSSNKRKPMLLCMANTSSKEVVAQQNVPDHDTEECYHPATSKRLPIPNLADTNFEMISDPIAVSSSPAFTSPIFTSRPNILERTSHSRNAASGRSQSSPVRSRAQAKSENLDRGPLRDIINRSNQSIQQQVEIETAAMEKQLQYSPRRGSFGRSQSDPSAIAVTTNVPKDCTKTKGKGRPRAPYKRVQSESAALGRKEISATIFSQLPPEKDPDREDIGPWSREALDLFDWRPPNWEQRLASKPSTIGMVD